MLNIEVRFLNGGGGHSERLSLSLVWILCNRKFLPLFTYPSEPANGQVESQNKESRELSKDRGRVMHILWVRM